MKKVPILGVGAVVIHQQRVLLVKRGNAPYQGMWCIPGGRVQYGETLQQAAEREILEETSIIIKAKQPVYTFEIIETENTEQPLHYVVIDLEADYVSGDIKPDDDALDARWFAKDEIAQDRVQELTRNFLKQWWLNH
ncbi:MAG: NUDIX hydrolase [Gammaproteobacteria bacterium]|jgi:8-oxo-dGTP diphosphatase